MEARERADTFSVGAMKYLLIAALMLQTPLVEAYSCRSSAVKRQFDKQNGFPNGRPGYVVDHICALAQGGLDTTANMQYQTVEAAKEKDKIENTPLGRYLYCNAGNSLPNRTVYNCK